MTERLHFHFSLSCIGEVNGNPLQCSCLKNPRDVGAWWVAIYGVVQSRTWLKLLSSSSSVVLWGRRDIAHKYHCHVWGVLTVDGPHWFWHSPSWCVLPRSTLLRLQVALQWHCPKCALHFVPFPGLSCSGALVLCKGTDPNGLFIFCPSQVQATQVTRYLASALTQMGYVCYALTQSQPLGFPAVPRGQSQVCCVSPLGSWSQAVTLLADVKHPGSQEDVVRNWHPAHSWEEDAVSGAKMAAAPCLPTLAVIHLPLCLWRGRTVYGIWVALFWYSFNTLFCESTRGHCEELGPFVSSDPTACVTISH